MKLSSITEWPSTCHTKLNKNEMFDVSYVDSVVALDSIQLHGDIKVLWQRVSCKVLADLTIGQLDMDYNYIPLDLCHPFHWKILSASAVHATVVVESNIYPGLIAPWSVNNLNYTTTITIQCSANAPCLSDLTERSWILGHDSRSFGVSLTLRSKQQFLGLPYLMNIFFSVWNCVFNCFECFYNWILIPKMALSVLKGLAKLKVTFFWADINLLNV